MKTLKFNPKKWDWYKYLDSSEAIKQKYFTDALSKSCDWVTCACGQLCNLLPKDDCKVPKDHELANLGVDFCDLIELCEWEEAIKTLDQIEIRTKFLLEQTDFKDPEIIK
ncbi:hypothetical protein [Clostridium sp.]|jgi:hypothetical protein|uniref:hypothetical protein n=1 Tax=Clostridium sp. TaxID=1506 RepID=UPI003EEFF8BD